MSESLINSPGGVLAILCAVCGFWFYGQQITGWKLFSYIPPLLFIYATPVVLNNTGVIPASSPVYSGLNSFAAANIHRPSLVPVSILMALIGYALGNYLVPLTAHLARIAVGQ